MATKWTTRLPASVATFLLAAALAMFFTPALAQRHGGGGHGGGGHGGSSMDHADEIDAGHSGGHGGQRGGHGMGMGRGGSSAQSLRDIFHEMESGSTSEHSATSRGHTSGSSATTTHGRSSKASAAKGRGKSGKASTAATTTHGKKSSTTAGRKGQTKPSANVAEDSDRPAYAGVPGKEGKPGRGNTESGSKKGDLYGDLYVILRDANGVPIYLTLADGTKVVQPIGADGQPLPLDAEGNLINPDLAVPVELGRLNVGRSPLQVLSAQYEEAINSINAADSVSLDASGRIVLTTDGVSAAIDSPLENLALYVELLNEGHITGLTDATIAKFEAANLSYLVDGSATLTESKLTTAASLLAAASDKTTTLTVDKVVDMNAILAIAGTLSVDGQIVTDPNTGATFVDYSSFTYDRSSVYGDTTVEVLVKEGDVYVPKTVNVYEAVFDSQDTPDGLSNVAAFTQAADDALQVIEYVHNNAVPEG